MDGQVNLVKFSNEYVFTYFIYLAIAVAIGLWQFRRNKKLASEWISPEMWQKVLVGFQPNQRRIRFFLLVLTVAFGLLGLARPQWGQQEETMRVTGLDIFFVLDVSNSMNVEDVAPSRLKKAQHVMRSIIERLKGDRVGVVLFAGSANLVSPLTTDHGYVLELVPTFGPDMVSAQGTDIGSALELTASAIERGAVDPTKADEASKVVILISDGEDLEASALVGGDAIKKVGAKFFAMGVGTEKGGPIPLRDERGNLSGYKKDGASPVTSHFDPKALQKLASHVGGQYFDVTANESEVDSIINDIGLMSRGEFQERKMTSYIDRFQIPLGIAVLLLVLELFIPIRSGRRTVGTLVLFFVLSLSPESQAQSIGAYQKNNKGIQSFQEGNIEEAQKQFDEAKKESPTEPRIDFNAGVVQAQKSELDTARSQFETALDEAIEKGDTETEAAARYNLGALAEQKKDYAKAAEEWSKVKNNSELEQKAKERIAKMLQKKQQQEQKDKQDQKDKKDQKDQKDDQKKDQKQGDKKDQKDGEKKDDEKKDDKGEDEKQDQKKSYSQKKGGNFKSGKLSKEDAERVMAELLGKEKELQKKIGKKRGRVDASGKDW